MLTSILNDVKPTKFVLIEDSLRLSGKNILDSITKTVCNQNKYDIHYFTFENTTTRIKTDFAGEKLHVHDYISNIWSNNFVEDLPLYKISGIVIIDSLSHIILEFGINTTYRTLHKLLNLCVQIITVLHTDTLEFPKEALSCFRHISTLNLKLELVGDTKRVEISHKKGGGRLIRKIEEYYFINNVFHTRDIERIVQSNILPNIQPEVLPENLSTFKISLDENEKKSREELTLPYTAKANSSQSELKGAGNVVYKLDAADDWDEEDPDDDLNI